MLVGLANLLYASARVSGKRALWEMEQVQVRDGGPDGDAASTADNELFLTQGVFVP